jgi:hypothetical protein
MPTVRVTIHLPYLLLLPPSEYPTPSEGGSVHLGDESVERPDGTGETRTGAWAIFDEHLGDDWSEGRDFLKGVDFGLRHKMTTGLRLLTGRSLYKEPGGFWQDLSASYNLRNKIIHEGQVANEDEAKLAIKVARQIVQIAAPR